jgi:hypothetical protein
LHDDEPLIIAKYLIAHLVVEQDTKGWYSHWARNKTIGDINLTPIRRLHLYQHYMDLANVLPEEVTSGTMSNSDATDRNARRVSLKKPGGGVGY